jgi:glycosyltransferase involved in cell wall biosynthesis
MNILQVSTYDIAGGAEKVAWNLFTGYRLRFHNSWLAVGTKRSTDADVLEIPRLRRRGAWARMLSAMAARVEPLQTHSRAARRASAVLRIANRGWPEIEKQRGREDFSFPGSRQLLYLPPLPPDVVHAHNLHVDYFDLRYLATLSRQLPVFITLHDEWLLTGHCACTLGCPRWESGCGHCPDLSTYPAVRRDATDWNWKRKRAIYERSQLHVAAPSRWLHDRMRRSILAPVDSRVIPYGVDFNNFQPAERSEVRAQLGYPENAIIILYVANFGKQNPFKDYETLEQAVARLRAPASSAHPVILIVLGGDGEDARLGEVDVRSVPFQSDASHVARYFQAADVYVHSAHTDNFPNTVLEALACGLPVVATAVGGIPEQVNEGETGYLTPRRDPVAMASRIDQLLTDYDLRKSMGERAAADARRRFDLNRQVVAYLDWYAEILLQNNAHIDGH